MRHTFILFLLIIISFFGNSQIIDQKSISDLKFRHIGPNGNRLTSVAGVPDKPLIYYVGAASGGVWKTTDGGLNWFPIFDDQEVHSIGAIAVAPSDPMVVYVGTGESSIRSNVSIGDGVYRSNDGGMTWEHIGLKNSGRISRIVVHPEDSDKIYVGALGHAYSPQKERGLYISSDGGKTWDHSLFIDENTGISDIVMDTDNPRVLLAGAWHLELKPWQRISGGKGSGIFKSRDGGESWVRLKNNGLPIKNVGKIALAMTPAAPDRVYALIETGDGVPYNGEETESGELWRSDDNGNTFSLINSNRELGSRQAYYTRTTASPDNPNEVYFISYRFFSSIDGGVSLENRSPISSPNWDHHEMWIDPNDGNRMAVAGDGGISISQNRGKTWLRTILPIAQLYHVTTDNNVPYNVLTNRQDGPSMKGPSRSRTANWFGPGMIQSGMWREVGGGESGFATADPENPDIVWSSASGYGPLGGIVTRYNENTKQYRQLEVWPEFTAGSHASLLKYRFQWTFPLLISPHDNKTVYVTSQYVHRTTNNGQTWDIISPDLSLNDKSMQGFSGGLTGDNIAVEYANVIYAFDESPIKKGLFWAGTNDGLVHISTDNGANWTNVTNNIPDLPKLGIVRNIEASKWDEGKAYITVDLHQLGNFEPYVYRTDNYGKSWKKITNGIKDSNLSYTRCLREDPVREGLLYLGTENKLYVSFDDGGEWQEMMSNLPHTPMYWIDIQEHFNDLVLGTYGRGIWILDDISPLQQLNKEIVKKESYLFDIKTSYRFHNVTSTLQIYPEASSGMDPPSGASINYWLKNSDKDVKLIITNSDNDTVKTINDKGNVGINRVWWDYRGENTDDIVFRTKPLYADWVSIGDDRIRKLPSSVSIMHPPGVYNVSLVIDDKIISTKKMNVLKDPHSEGTLEDIGLQISLMKKIYDDLNITSNYVNSIEKVRRQLLDLKSILSSSENNQSIILKINEIENKFLEIEKKLLQLQTTGTGQDEVRYEKMIGEKLAYLANNVPNADFKPADSYYEVYEILHKRLENVGIEYDNLMDSELKAFIQKLNSEGVNTIVLK